MFVESKKYKRCETTTAIIIFPVTYPESTRTKDNNTISITTQKYAEVEARAITKESVTKIDGGIPRNTTSGDNADSVEDG